MDEHVFDLDKIESITGIDPQGTGQISIQHAIRQVIHNNTLRGVLSVADAQKSLLEDLRSLVALSEIQTR